MKKSILLLGLLPITISISACSSLGLDNGGTSTWDHYDNSMVKSIIGPTGELQSAPAPKNYQPSRKYYVTPEEQQKYNAVNDRVQQHVQQLQSQKSGDTTSNNTIPVNSNTAN